LEENGWHLGNDQIKNIGSFIQLKYLKINCSSVTMLPDDIGNLYNLQTVNTCGCRIQMLPPSTGRLQNLVHLLVDFLWEVRPGLVPKNFCLNPSHRMFGHIYGVLNVDEKKLIAQFSGKSRDESFKPK
jgi:hypothetical protein